MPAPILSVKKWIFIFQEVDGGTDDLSSTASLVYKVQKQTH